MTCSVLIADDHPIFRNGIKVILKGMNDIELCAEASNGEEAYTFICSVFPDIAILDLDMPILNGIDVCRKVKEEGLSSKCIILTMHKEKHFFNEAMESGAMGYILKDHAEDELIRCINNVREGKKYVSDRIAEYLTEIDTGREIDEGIRKNFQLLTATEKVIIRLVSQGKSSLEIASHLFISSNTVDNHRANMTKKLQLEGKNSLLKFAIQHIDLCS